MNDNEINSNNSELPPYHHGAEDVESACGINPGRKGGMSDAAGNIREGLFKREKVCTSHVVELIETQPGLNIRERILTALLMGMAKGVSDAPDILMKMMKAIYEERGREFNGFDGL